MNSLILSLHFYEFFQNWWIFKEVTAKIRGTFTMNQSRENNACLPSQTYNQEVGCRTGTCSATWLRTITHSDLPLWCKCILKYQCSELHVSLSFHKNDKLGQLDKFCRTRVYKCTFTFNSLTWFFKLTQTRIHYFFFENSMIAHTALVLYDTFASRFASIPSILDSLYLLKLRDNSG